eukprot:Blabericola_migrator_1__6317@NODE_318_length_9886_cov_105_778796_g259_i0_p6_GENE_NODE_318_length_9886_cov_105_778796_g259_i0NODE_318_length_9886_cov_105_778796_g259_i0_p6_ORF_typecomplete_len290_score50_33_NODE_318_length_9886_cov_105_778796_g259_i088589727
MKHYCLPLLLLTASSPFLVGSDDIRRCVAHRDLNTYVQNRRMVRKRTGWMNGQSNALTPRPASSLSLFNGNQGSSILSLISRQLVSRVYVPMCPKLELTEALMQMFSNPGPGPQSKVHGVAALFYQVLKKEIQCDPSEEAHAPTKPSLLSEFFKDFYCTDTSDEDELFVTSQPQCAKINDEMSFTQTQTDADENLDCIAEDEVYFDASDDDFWFETYMELDEDDNDWTAPYDEEFIPQSEPLEWQREIPTTKPMGTLLDGDDPAASMTNLLMEALLSEMIQALKELDSM